MSIKPTDIDNILKDEFNKKTIKLSNKVVKYAENRIKNFFEDFDSGDYCEDILELEELNEDKSAQVDADIQELMVSLTTAMLKDLAEFKTKLRTICES